MVTYLSTAMARRLDGGHQGDAGHGVKDVVHVLDELVLQRQVVAVDHGDEGWL